MFMRVVRGRFDPSRFDEAVGQQLGQDVVASIRRQPGFQSLMNGADRTTGQTILVSTWDTEEHARFSRDALGDTQSRMQALGAEVEPPEFFEVTTT
jgi:heme-degrading monooxygenase HmoA